MEGPSLLLDLIGLIAEIQYSGFSKWGIFPDPPVLMILKLCQNKESLARGNLAKSLRGVGGHTALWSLER